MPVLGSEVSSSRCEGCDDSLYVLTIHSSFQKRLWMPNEVVVKAEIGLNSSQSQGGVVSTNRFFVLSQIGFLFIFL
jgi:hypothetical protein